MTISSETRKAGPYIGNGTLGTYAFSFKVFAAADLVVTTVDTTTTVETELVINSDYTVTLNGDQNASPGGTITLTAGNLATGTNLVITSDVAYTQTVDLTNQGGFYPQVITVALDRLTVLVQQIKGIVGRGIRQPVTDEDEMTDLPSALERANKVLSFDADGNPIATVPASGSIAEFAVDLANDSNPALGAGLVGYKGRTQAEKNDDIVSVKDFGAIGDGVADDTAAIQAALSSVKQEYYDKGSAKLVIPAPSKFYKISDTLDLTEIWNLSLVGDNPYMFQRQSGPVDIDTDYATFHWYGPADKAMMRADYTFGLVLENISFNGREIAKIGIDIAPETSVASVTRFIEMRNVGVRHCDFGIRIGDLLEQTDHGPINCYNLWVTNNTSAGILVNSGNNFVELINPVLFNNGYAPTTGNSFISDGNNVGAQINHLAGFLTVTGLTTDHSGGALEVTYSTIFQAGGSIKINGAWDDSPTKPFYRGSATRPVYFNGVTHYDAGMTPSGTPDSIIYSGEQPLVLESCYLYGNVQINSGTQASVIDLGTRFAREGAGFTGDMVTTYGGLIRMAKSGANSLDMSVGGDIPTDVIRRPFTVWSDGSHTGLVRATRGAGSYKVTESLISGVLNFLGNAYFDANTGQFKSIKSGPCWRVAHSQTAQTFEVSSASGAGEVIVFSNGHGFHSSSGLPNGIPMIDLGGRRVTYETAAPASGEWSAGSIVFNASPVSGGFVGWVCTTGGTPGTWHTFGLIS